MNSSFKIPALLALCLAAPAFAHVSLQQAQADGGSSYQAVLRVGHGCEGAPTTAISVQLPAGFDSVQPQARAGWTQERRGNEVSWTAASKQAALPATATGDFVIDTKLTSRPGPLWLKVRQTCGQRRIDWSDLPDRGTATEGMKTPAVLLLVRAPALVKVEQAWVRPSVPGQQGTGGYMLLTARQGLRLVGASSPVAGVAEVHVM